MMSNFVKIKAGNISHLTDARYFAAIGAEWVGLNFRKEMNALSVEDAVTVKNWIVGPSIVAEFDLFDPDYIFQICNALQTNIIQLPVSEIPEDGTSDYEIFAAYKNTAPVDAAKISVLETEDFSLIEQLLETDNNYIFNLNNNFELAKKIVGKDTFFALQIEGSAEEETGVKSFEEINSFFDWMEENELFEI